MSHYTTGKWREGGYEGLYLASQALAYVGDG